MGGDFKLQIAPVLKVLLFDWLVPDYQCTVQTLKPIILINKRGNFDICTKLVHNLNMNPAGTHV